MLAAAKAAVRDIPVKWNQRSTRDLVMSPRGRPTTMKAAHKKWMTMSVSAKSGFIV